VCVKYIIALILVATALLLSVSREIFFSSFFCCTRYGTRVENNNFGGNTNGILIEASATGNVIRENIIAGNPPVQVSRTSPAGVVGFDSVDQSTTAGSGSRNTIENNLCITYAGPSSPPPCPNLPAVSIQHDADSPDRDDRGGQDDDDR
jgi:parallel beta-helix repeat (two copies)